MGKTYDNFKKDFAAIEQKLKTAMARDLTYRTNYQKQRLTMLEGAAVIGLRVQALKDLGQAGNSIDDFKNDPQVKDMLETSEEFAEGLDKLYATLKPEQDALVKSLNKLQTELEAEIKTRQKAVSAKLGSGSKSLPDMVTLLSDVKARRAEKEVNAFLVGKIIKPEKWRADVSGYIRSEIGKTRAEALSDFQQTMRQELLSLRNLSAKVNRATKLHGDLQAARDKARNAVTSKNAGELKDAQDDAKTLFEQLDEIASEYAKAMKDNWIIARVDESKDKAKILKGVDVIAEARKRAEDIAESIAELQPE
jgi:hypothetical protein